MAISETINLEQEKALRQELRKVRAANLMHPNFARVRYVRYADDFLISVIYSYNLATQIKDLVGQFLKE